MYRSQDSARRTATKSNKNTKPTTRDHHEAHDDGTFPPSLATLLGRTGTVYVPNYLACFVHEVNSGPCFSAPRPVVSIGLLVGLASGLLPWLHHLGTLRTVANLTGHCITLRGMILVVNKLLSLR